MSDLLVTQFDELRQAPQIVDHRIQSVLPTQGDEPLVSVLALGVSSSSGSRPMTLIRWVWTEQVDATKSNVTVALVAPARFT